MSTLLRSLLDLPWLGGALALALALAAGCGNDDQQSAAPGGATGSPSAGSAGAAGAPEEPGAGGAEASANGGGGGDEAPLYALATTVFDDTSAATYVVLLDSLVARQLELSEAPEFAGWSSVATLDGALFVGHGEKPEVVRYPVEADGTLGDAGTTALSFAPYGLTTTSFSFNTFVDATMAHMTLEETGRVLWNPTGLELVTSKETPEILAERDGMTVTAANYQGRVVQNGKVLQPFFWHDADWFQFHQQSQIGVFSREGELEALLDAPCPALQIATQDEDGNTYFTGMVDTIGYQLTDDATLQRCAVRIDAGEQQIAAGWPRRLEELTGGRPTGTLHYLQDGVGVLTVYHVENADPSSDTFLDDWATDNWGLWLVDLEAWQAEPIEAWPLGASNVFFSRAGDRTFLHRVEADFSSTIIYEITADGGVLETLSIPGYAAYPMLRVR